MEQAKKSELSDKQGWDAYWSAKRQRVAYDLVAEFYRKFIIRPSLNRFVGKYFRKGADVLHAGCGSGQVDADIRDQVKITGLDISKNALKIYERENQGKCQTLHGSIFSIPLAQASMDGIYNLGVMEHFHEDEIEKILKEFHRVLRPDGRIILFWPPEFGASVLFFKGLRGTIKAVSGKDVKFHPDEVCRVKSRKHVTRLLEAAQFKVIDYSFGARDAFTYSIIVGEKT